MKSKIAILCLLSILFLNCSKTEKVQELEQVEIQDSNVVTFKAPILIDTFAYFIEHDSERYFHHSSAQSVYVGLIEDTIIISPKIYEYPQEMEFESKQDLKKRLGRVKKFKSYFPDQTEWMTRNSESNKYSKLIEADSGDLKIYIDSTQIVNDWGRECYPVFVQNISDDTIFIYDQHGISFDLEIYFGNHKTYQESEVIVSSLDGIIPAILPPNELIISSIKMYHPEKVEYIQLTLNGNKSNKVKLKTRKWGAYE